MNNLYEYFKNNIDENKMSHSFLIGNVKFDNIKIDLYKIFKDFIFKCKNISENNPDIYIIKPEKDNISKETIKELIGEISTTSQFNNNKVYVIDQCEKLNEYSYNSILKTLEEPSNNIYAFLITSNIDSIKDTIVSRCQKIFISSEIKENDFDEETIEISNKILEYIEKYNINIISRHPEIYNLIDNRDKLSKILEYLLNYYFKKINECINVNNKDLEILSKKVLVINDSLNELNNYLNKNLSIDRFIIKMWRCTYENS